MPARARRLLAAVRRPRALPQLRLPLVSLPLVTLSLVALPLAALPFLAPTAGAATRAQTSSSGSGLLLLMDASGSMNEPAGGGTTKIAAAKAALQQVVAGLPAGSDVGLRVYGATKDKGCDDTTLVAPVGPLDRARLDAAIASFRPRGDTPIGASLKAAATDLKGVPGRKTIVLVSDGEDNCAPPDPCEVARQLSRQGLDLRVEAIGFRVDAAARQQLACIAKATGGAYHDAPDARTLGAQLDSLSLRAFRGFVPQGSPITGTPDAEGAPTMTPGAYVDQLAPGEAKYYAIDVPEGALPVVNGALIAGATQPRLRYPENFIVILRGEQGRECGRGVSSQTSVTFTASATATGARTAAGGGECTSPHRVVEVQRQLTGGQGVNTVELLFDLLGAPDPSAPPAAQVPPGPAGGTPSRPQDVRGGTSYNDAPTIGSGSWTDTVRSSETLYYRVPVGWGQSLRVTAAFTLLTAAKGKDGYLQPLLEVHDALRDDPLDRQLVQLGSTDTRQVSITTPAVTAPASADAEVVPFKVAGDEFVVINASPGVGTTGAGAARVRLDVAVLGQQVEGPRLAAVSRTVSPSPSPSVGAATSSTSARPLAADAPAGTGGAGPASWVLGALAVIVVAGGVAVLLRRRAGRQGG